MDYSNSVLSLKLSTRFIDGSNKLYILLVFIRGYLE